MPNSLYVCARCRYQISKKDFWLLLDRIDIHIEAPRVDYDKLSGERVEETSESISARVQAVRNIPLARFANIEASNIVANADMHVGEIRQYCKLQEDGQGLKLTRTIATSRQATLVSLSVCPFRLCARGLYSILCWGERKVSFHVGAIMKLDHIKFVRCWL